MVNKAFATPKHWAHELSSCRYIREFGTNMEYPVLKGLAACCLREAAKQVLHILLVQAMQKAF